MANFEHLAILKQGKEAWNQWRQENPTIIPDLSDAVVNWHSHKLDFSSINLSNCNLQEVDLSYNELENANFRFASLWGSNLACARIEHADFHRACLIHADFHRACLIHADFSAANACGACFVEADLEEANFSGALLRGAEFSGSNMGRTIFHDNSLIGATGLEAVTHETASILDIATIYRSERTIPETFLRGCGIPEDFIAYMRSSAIAPIQYQSCFISYSHKDEEFAQRLHARMRQKNLRVWYAAEDMAGGKKLHEQIDHAIQLHDRLLIVLSEHSLKSEWVMTEIRKARKQELRSGTRKLFPISLVDFTAIKEWECFDADNGKDLAVEMREYFIPDFSNWKDQDSFEEAFDRLYRDLKVESERP